MMLNAMYMGWRMILPNNAKKKVKPQAQASQVWAQQLLTELFSNISSHKCACTHALFSLYTKVPSPPSV